MNYLCWFGFALAVISLLGLGASGPGYRFGLWGFQAGLGMAKYSAYVSLAAIVTHKCEGDFLGKLNAAQKRAYQRDQERCRRKYRSEDGSMYRSFEAFCGANVARNYSARFLRNVPSGRI